MVDPEVVRRRLREIDRRLVALRSLQQLGRDRFLGDATVQAAVERHLQLAIQAGIDAASHVLATDFPDTPSSYAEVFELLARHGVLGAGLARRLARAAALRNLLVHGYADVDPARIWAHLAELEDLEALARALEAHLGARGHPAGT